MKNSPLNNSDLENAETIASPVDGLPLPGGSVSIDTLGSDPARSRFRSSSGAIGAAARGLVRLVEGSTPQLSGETRDVLRHRLFIAVSLFFGCFTAFLIRSFFVEDDWRHVDGSAMWYVHLSVTIAMGVLAAALYRFRNCSTTKLRALEFLAFGIPVVFFLTYDIKILSLAANSADAPHLPNIIVPWLLLIFTYALFIPNNWRRAIWIIVPIGLAPILLAKWQNSVCEGFQNCMLNETFSSYHTEQAMVMIFGMTIATVGVHTINTLRREAFEAKQLGQYRLSRRIGSGGMGEVYLAEHQMMKRPCAIKVIRPEKAGDPRTLARFEREVRMTAKLSHWNSVDIFDYGSAEDGTFYYVMEYLPGHNTGELVAMAGALPAARVVYLMDQVCRALSEAHDMDLVHRDLKPANIFCAHRGGEYDVAKLLDFGLAKPTVNSTEDNSELTQEGAITGSPMFMSPEQATGEREADVRSDIYSLGCVMYYLLSGRPPFDYQQSVKVIIAHASEEVTPLSEFVPDVPPELEKIVHHCLEKSPEDRFQTVEELRLALVDLQLDDYWNAEKAAKWWNCNGCPQRKAFDEAALAIA